ncbi:hypothetical protein C4D60_Mb08t17730 [Musa balbisiana]|uniref:Uncharacterized protein n=1 Tax=Musa balbisiana TaxID=52838 RepID=A0A4S8K4L3_MUSBA|nr:hypothetical protein C4D60_Mb08t17730 [Musa balbisiana]
MMQGGVFVTGFPTEDGMGFIKILKHLLVDINMVLFMSGYMRNILYRIVLRDLLERLRLILGFEEEEGFLELQEEDQEE